MAFGCSGIQIIFVVKYVAHPCTQLKAIANAVAFFLFEWL